MIIWLLEPYLLCRLQILSIMTCLQNLQHNPGLQRPWKRRLLKTFLKAFEDIFEGFWRHFWRLLKTFLEREKMMVTSIFSFSCNVFNPSQKELLILTFPKQALVCMCLQFMSSENTAGKGEIACNEQFLLFWHCFLSVWRTFFHYHQIWNCHLQTLWIWKSLKFVVWERVNLHLLCCLQILWISTSLKFCFLELNTFSTLLCFSLYRKVNKSYRGRSCPIVVHCR